MKINALIVLLSALSVVPSHKDLVDTKVTAEKDSSVNSWTKLVDGTSHEYSDTTSYVKYRTGPHTITHLTMVCSIRWKWDHCYPLVAGQEYDAKIDYKKKEVTITAQINGNLRPATTFKNQATNVEYEEEK
jgi:hypothetical protein